MNVIVVGESSVIEECVISLAKKAVEISTLGRIPGNGDLVCETLHRGAHVAVVDITAAGIKGLDTIYRLRVGIPDLHIVAVSSVPAKYLARSACECGADMFVRLSDFETHLWPRLKEMIGSASLQDGVRHGH